MKLWFLEGTNHKLWSPMWDKVHKMVVRAENEEQARQLASTCAGDEGIQAWLDPNNSSCVELLNEGDAEVVIIYRTDG